MLQQSLVIFKPDAVQRRLVGRILQRFEDAGLKICAMRMTTVTAVQSRDHYEEHADKHFYPLLERYITSAPVLIMILSGVDAIAKIRSMLGHTLPAQATPGTIRGDFAHMGNGAAAEQDQIRPVFNLVHASANAEEARREIDLWFYADDISQPSFGDDYILGL